MENSLSLLARIIYNLSQEINKCEYILDLIYDRTNPDIEYAIEEVVDKYTHYDNDDEFCIDIQIDSDLVELVASFAKGYGIVTDSYRTLSEILDEPDEAARMSIVREFQDEVDMIIDVIQTNETHVKEIYSYYPTKKKMRKKNV